MPLFIEQKKAALPSSLDELVGFRDELGGENPWWKRVIGCNGVGSSIPFDLGDVGGRINEVSRDLRV